MLAVIFDYFRQLGASISQGWNWFWFTPRDPFALGVLRWITGCLLFVLIWSYGPDLGPLFSDSGFLPSKSLHALLDTQYNIDSDDDGATSLLTKPLTPSLWDDPSFHDPVRRQVVQVVTLAVVVVFTLGIFTRVTSVLAFLLFLSYVHRIGPLTTEFEAMLAVSLFYLCLGPCGSALSVDSFLASRKQWFDYFTGPSGAKPPVFGQPLWSAGVATRLLQVHLTLVMLTMSLGKLVFDDWWNGDAAWWLLVQDRQQWFDLSFLYDAFGLVSIWSHTILWTQLAFVVCVWVPILRPIALAVNTLIWGSLILLTGQIEFCLLMIGLNVAFIAPETLRKFLGLLSGEKAVKVLYDRKCPLCRASFSRIMALDMTNVVEPLDLNQVDPASVHPKLTREMCLQAMQVVESSKRSPREGYEGFVRLTRRLPALWPIAPITFIPGVASIGDALYKRVAASRKRDVCNDDVCAIPSAKSETAEPGAVNEPGAAGEPKSKKGNSNRNVRSSS